VKPKKPQIDTTLKPGIIRPSPTISYLKTPNFP
jgi:hypothetical protein